MTEPDDVDEQDADDGPGQSGVAIPIPPEYNEAEQDAFRRGAYMMAQLFGHAAQTYVQAIGADGEFPDAPGDDEPDEDADECRECGLELLDSMGAAETEYSPAGRVCPECEL